MKLCCMCDVRQGGGQSGDYKEQAEWKCGLSGHKENSMICGVSFI